MNGLSRRGGIYRYSAANYKVSAPGPGTGEDRSMADIDRRRLALENRSLALRKIDDAPFSWVDVRLFLILENWLTSGVFWSLELDCKHLEVMSLT